MENVTLEDVEKFKTFVGLAETGELQSAVDTVGSMKVNPYYYQDPRIVNAVGFFMNTIAPLGQETYEAGQESFTTKQVMDKVVDYAGAGLIPVGRVITLADKAGYLVQRSVNEGTPLSKMFSPTKGILNVEPADVFITRYSAPEARGCIGGVSSGILGATVGITLIDAPPIQKPIMIASSFFIATWAGLTVSEKYGRLKAGRQAYKYYHSKN